MLELLESLALWPYQAVDDLEEPLEKLVLSLDLLQVFARESLELHGKYSDGIFLGLTLLGHFRCLFLNVDSDESRNRFKGLGVLVFERLSFESQLLHVIAHLLQLGLVE